MFRKQLFIFLVTCLLGFSHFLSAAELEKKTFGGKNGWNILAAENGVQRGKGKYGYESLELSTDFAKVNQSVDLLLSFENGRVEDEAGNYSVINSTLSATSGIAAMGKGSGLSRGLKSGLRLKGKPGSIFGSSGLVGAFTIEFWLKPAITENGEKVFNWRSSRIAKNTPVYQIIHSSFINNKLEWIFTNVFSGPNFEENEIILTSYSSIIPEKWAQHIITYDDDKGLLEYRINGKIEAITYVTSTGREDGTVHPAALGSITEIEICQKFTGLIDDFVIFRGVQGDRVRDIYNTSGGRIETQPIETNGLGSQAVSLSAVLDKPPQTEVQFFIRSGNNFYEWSDSYPEWIPVNLNAPIKNVSGVFFQIAADLYPNGAGDTTPSISEISINYSETVPPLPPSMVRAETGNGYVDLQWSKSIDENVGGYLIYYGEKPGEYLGRIALEGFSPIRAGNVLSHRLNGLQNGRIYYFSIVAYSSYDQRIVGQLSKEVYARPLRNAL